MALLLLSSVVNEVKVDACEINYHVTSQNLTFQKKQYANTIKSRCALLTTFFLKQNEGSNNSEQALTNTFVQPTIAFI